MKEHLEIDIRNFPEKRITLIHLKGVINIHTLNNLQEKISSFIDPPKTHIVLDMKEVDLLTSSGIGFLFELSDKLYKTSYKLFLLSPSEKVLKTIEITGLKDFFSICYTLEEVEKEIQTTS